MHRRLAHGIALLALAGAGLAGVGPAPRVAQAVDAAECTTPSWIAGQTLTCSGALVYRDYVYDDYGANTGVPASSTGGLSNPAGDVRYPVGAESTADLVRFDLTVVGDHLHAKFELDALYTASSTIAAVAIDTDNNPNTGGGKWTGLSVSSSGWDTLATFSTGIPMTNTIEGDIALPDNSFGVWRVQAVTAQADGTVMNVAFRGTQELGNWWEDNQAAALAGGTIDAFAVTVQSSATGFSDVSPVSVLGGGHTYERVYTSAFTLGTGEGMTYLGFTRAGTPGSGRNDFSQVFNFVGRYQPYGLYVPPGNTAHGLQLVMHGYSANHASLMRQRGLTTNVGDALDRVLVNPLGRGPSGWYSSYSERDVLDVLADVEATYPIDRDKEFAGGYSMGGYGTFRFAELFPDRFAGYTAWVGFTGDCLNGTPAAGGCPSGAVGNVINYVGNLANIPGSMMYSGGDELVWAPSALGMADAFAATSNLYKWFFHPAAEHLTYALVDDWRKETQFTATLSRAAHYPHVHYTTEPLVDTPDLGLVHNRAYWVSNIDTGGALGTVDVTTHGCGGQIAETLEHQDFGTDPVPWVSREGQLRGFNQVIAANQLEGSITHVSSLTVDVASACLDPGPVDYTFTTDGPATITLSDSRTITLSHAGTFTGTV